MLVMRMRWLAAMLTLSVDLVAQATHAAADPEPTPVRVMTFNIRFGTANDGKDRWEHRAHRVVERIRAFDPDVFGVQEALDFQVEQLRHALPAYHTLGAFRQGGKSGEACTVFVRGSRFAIEDSGTSWLSERPDAVASRGWDAALPRIWTWAVLRDRIDHGRFLFANTHFDHRGKRARLESAKTISTWRKDHDLPVLLTGDLNAGEDSEPIQWLKEHGLRDTFRVRHPDADAVGTFSGFRKRSRAKIDYVLCSSEFTVVAAAIDTEQVDGRFPSDHFPVTAQVTLPRAEAPRLMPVVRGEPWHVGSNPDLGPLSGEKQEVVDHTIFRSVDGAWHLWACVRGTRVGRLLYAWEGNSLLQRRWTPKGIAMRVSREHGESIDDWGGKEWIQAPHVIQHDNRYFMLYGGHRSELEHCQICLATSPDGRNFTRHENRLLQSRVFVGPGEARDPMTIQIGDTFHCYYTGNPDPRKRRDVGGIYCRTSKNLMTWSEAKRVAFGGRAGSGMWSAECPHVVRREGAYYLFRTTSYRKPLTHVYRSTDPMDFGLDSDAKLIGTIPVAAPEVVSHDGRDFISTVHDLQGGVQLVRLEWVRR